MKYIRDLGGMKTIEGKTLKSGLLFRSSQLYEVSSKQEDYLKTLNIKRIIDLRNEQEAIDEPDIDLGKVHYINISLIDNNLNGLTHESRSKQVLLLRELPTAKETYIDFIKDEFCINRIKKTIREIVLNDEYPTIIHCVTGKDRAGIITFILLRILGVSYEDAMKDYLKQLKYYHNHARFVFMIAYIVSRDKPLAIKAYEWYVVRKDFIDAALEEIDKRFGSFDNFIKDYIGLSQNDIDSFKNRLLIG